MDNQLILGFLLTIMPFTEIRLGLPIIIDYTLKNNLPIFPFFLITVLLNILIIPIIYLFLDRIHIHLLKFKNYNKIINIPLKRLQKRVNKLDIKFQKIGFIALFLFVSIPLPTTGAWTATFASWMLKLDKKKSIIAISAGILMAALIVLFFSYNILNFF